MKQLSPQNKKLSLVIVSLCSLCLLAVGIVHVYDLFFADHGPAHPSFEGYVPSKQLQGNDIQSKQLSRIKEPGINVWRFDYTLRYPSNVTVYERQASDDIWCTSQNTSPTKNYTGSCKEEPLAGGRYMVRTSYYMQKLFSVEVRATIGSTAFYISIPEERLSSCVDYDWKSYFDSMRSVDIHDEPFKKVQLPAQNFG